MMQNDFLKYLESTSKKFGKEKEAWDIVLYGSSVKAKEIPNDVDLLIIFLEKKLDERMKVAQEFKEILRRNMKKSVVFDIKTINLKEMFDKNFLARQGILVEGYSLIDSTFFAKKFGFEGFFLFTYGLKNLNHNEKTKFTYSLIGRKREGMLKLTSARYLGKGAVAVPAETSSIFEDFLKRWKVNYRENKILISSA